MRRSRLPAVAATLLTFAAFGAIAPPSDAGAAGGDPAARGLDLFVDAPDRAVPGARLPLQIQAYGFPTATALAALPGAAIEAVWDPESLGPGVRRAPDAEKAQADANGRVHLDVPVPEGDERSLTLLLGATFGEHRRTIEVQVYRTAPRALSLIVPDDRVVPGGATSAWVIVRDAGTGRPAAGEGVLFELTEGGVPRYTARATTDAAGTAIARVPIPWTDEPAMAWELTARAESAGNDVQGVATATLTPREETPGEPQLTAEWGAPRALPGDRPDFVLRLRDASDRPVAGGAVRYWIGPKGTSPPSPTEDVKEWERASTLAKADAAGEVRGAIDAPTTMRRGATTTMRLVAHAELFGHELHAEKVIEVTTPSPTVEAVPEVGQLVPGVEQAVVVRVRDARDRPVSGAFTVEGDGLSQKVTTNALGEAEVRWRPPRDVGASRQVGPCAWSVAATVTVRPAAGIAALDGRTEPFSTCVNVNREVAGLVRAERPMVTAGGAMRVRLAEAEQAAAKAGDRAAKGAPAWSVMAAPLRPSGATAVSAWMEDAAAGLELPMASVAPGAWLLGGVAPRPDRAARVAPGRVLVAPAVVPRVSAKVTGGRAAPLGTVEVDVDLVDGQGRGLPGSIAAVLIDAYGGGTIDGLVGLDTRRGLCRTLGVEREACDPFFDDASADTLRRRVLGAQRVPEPSARRDPGGTAKQELRDAFKSVLLSLEGAVMDATMQPDSLQDAFRKEHNAYSFNPELMSLVTAAMDPPPVTPGGEPIALGDLVALDRQVTYDNVARRVARLKLFRVLSAVRSYRRDRSVDPDEPVLRDPNAILRRLVSRSQLSAQDLVDPWGGTIAFVKGQGQRLPFMTVKGFELHTPGPDNKLGTADDVKSPFERVVRSGTPYAESMEEDRLVDAELEMEVSDATVDAWRTTLEEVTGISLGNIGLIGEGFGAGGAGYGSGLGHVRGGMTSVDRRSKGISSGAAFWLAPQRTDANGHLHVRVPLGDVETTWRLAVVGVPDGASPAVASIDIPSALPLSARVDAGAAWVAGDEADVIVTVRNRTASAQKVELALSAGGVAAAAGAGTRSVTVAAGGAADVPVHVRARAAGTASLQVVAKGTGGVADSTTHTWEVKPAGEVVDLTSTQWVTSNTTLALSQVSPQLRATGTAKLVLERGNAASIAAALDSLDPDAIHSQDGLSYAQEAAARIEKWATARGGEADPLAVRARDRVRRAIGRMLARKAAMRVDGGWRAQRRAAQWAPPDLVSAVAKIDDCPPDTSPGLADGLALIEAEPSAADGAIDACWDSLATSVVASVNASNDPVALARALLAFAERPHRAALAASLADKLRAWVKLRPSGGVTLPAAASANRASRALVFAALLRGAGLGKPAAAGPDRLQAWLRVQRDAEGSYGSALATLAAVRALLASPAEAEQPTKVTVTVEGAAPREVVVGPNATVEVPLGPKALSVELAAAGPGVLARLVRPGLRAWASPPDSSASPIALELTWPEDARAGRKGVLHVAVSGRASRAMTADVRIPLPPGASLAERTAGVQQIQGVLVLRPSLDAQGTATFLELPIRFALAGRFTVPEARARPAFEEGARAVAPARPLVVR